MRTLSASCWKTALSALFIGAANWLGYVCRPIATDHVDASLGYFINPLVNVALGYLVLPNACRAAQWVTIGFATGRACWWHDLAAARALDLADAGCHLRAVWAHAQDLAAGRHRRSLTLETLLLAPIAIVALAWWTAQGQHALTDPPTRLAAGHRPAHGSGALMLFCRRARRIPLSTLGLIQYMSPTLQLLLGVWVYHEPMSSAA